MRQVFMDDRRESQSQESRNTSDDSHRESWTVWMPKCVNIGLSVHRECVVISAAPQPGPQNPHPQQFSKSVYAVYCILLLVLHTIILFNMSSSKKGIRVTSTPTMTGSIKD